ncbi:hypothetical protein C8Q79DRAFT_30379 [Trametes meyenii]|nr:hypothetical protein C8Q79DRAFT_30379 [Trametes meyenii]
MAFPVRPTCRLRATIALLFERPSCVHTQVCISRPHGPWPRVKAFLRRVLPYRPSRSMCPACLKLSSDCPGGPTVAPHCPLIPPLVLRAGRLCICLTSKYCSCNPSAGDAPSHSILQHESRSVRSTPTLCFLIEPLASAHLTQHNAYPPWTPSTPPTTSLATAQSSIPRRASPPHIWISL